MRRVSSFKRHLIPSIRPQTIKGLPKQRLGLYFMCMCVEFVTFFQEPSGQSTRTFNMSCTDRLQANVQHCSSGNNLGLDCSGVAPLGAQGSHLCKLTSPLLLSGCQKADPVIQWRWSDSSGGRGAIWGSPTSLGACCPWPLPKAC